MTVIVYKDGVMAADTGCFQESTIISTRETKIKRAPDGTLFACAGGVDDIERFAVWAMEGFNPSDRPSKTENFGALTVTPTGEIVQYGPSFYAYRPSGDWAVEGCESAFLTAALLCGKTAAEAVQLAINHTVWAAGTVQEVRL